MLALGTAGISAVVAQVRCVDAAREAARLAARGDEASAVAVVGSIAPAGAVVRLHRDGGVVVATVTVRPDLFPVLDIGAHGVAAVEPVQ